MVCDCPIWWLSTDWDQPIIWERYMPFLISVTSIRNCTRFLIFYIPRTGSDLFFWIVHLYPVNGRNYIKRNQYSCRGLLFCCNFYQFCSSNSCMYPPFKTRGVVQQFVSYLGHIFVWSRSVLGQSASARL